MPRVWRTATAQFGASADGRGYVGAPRHLFAEPDSGRFEAAILVEARHGKAGAVEFDRLLKKPGVSTIAVDAEQVEVARLGCRKHRKGRRPAGLNYGDLFAYALATTSVEPLLFKGDDFSKTDVVDALGEW